MNKLLDGQGFVTLIDNMGNDLSVVNAARVSFGKRKETFDNNDKTLIKYLLTNKHSSPFEHVMFTFHVKCPLFVRSQWMRHRVWSFNEISRRYTSEDISFYVPCELRKQSTDNKQASEGVFIGNENNQMVNSIHYIVEESKAIYNELLARGVSREMARMVLPQNLYTEFYGTVDLWNLFHFLDLRNHPHAQLEIRVYAEEIEKIIQKIVPASYEAWKNLK